MLRVLFGPGLPLATVVLDFHYRLSSFLVSPAPSFSITDHKCVLRSCVLLRSTSGESNLLGC